MSNAELRGSERPAGAPLGMSLDAADAVLNALPLPVIIVAADGKLADANVAAESFFELSVLHLRRQYLRELVPFGSPLLSLVDQVRNRGAAVNEYKVDLSTPRNPGDRLVDLYVAPLPERPAHIVVMLQERTIAEKMDRQLTHRGAARSVSALAAMLAHEIKNPLSGIRGAAQLLEQSAGDEDRTLTRLICDEADRIVKLVDRMEVFSDERPVEREPVNIHVVLEHVKRLAQSGFARGTSSSSRSTTPRCRRCYANRDQLVQVFLNLVKNAAEAIGETTPDGEIQITTAFRPGVRLSMPGLKTPRLAAARILHQGQRAGRARRPAAPSVRSVRDHQADRHGSRPRARGQDRRRSRRHHRMRISASADHLPCADAHVHW